eukprot:GHRR01000898.1.p1 GENE.GHRR01000898.1~~GHRR01000898.1.p1  ORF type:complete len:167 (+),score=44.53 GHRR01000898.1:224-724(+)
MSIAARLAQIVAGRASRSLLLQSQALPSASFALTSWLKPGTGAFHTSTSRWQAEAPTTTGSAVTTPGEKYDYLKDKDIWDEAWAYEPRFGTEDNPIVVPSLEKSRIIGVTDPEDDTLVIWGIIRAGEPPKQLVAGGEFFVLHEVDRVPKVGDKLGIPLVPDVGAIH